MLSTYIIVERFMTKFCFLFQVYLHVRFIWRRSRLLLPVIQLGAICLACWVAVSRVSDYKHHWSDVVGGAILGALGCVFTVCVPYINTLL